MNVAFCVGATHAFSGSGLRELEWGGDPGGEATMSHWASNFSSLLGL